MALILVVDDEEMIREALAQIFEEEGHKVVGQPTAHDALRWLKKYKPDAIFLDVKMPRMSGLEALEEFQKIHPDVPIIMLTGHGNEEVAFEAARKGAFDYISKPPDLNKLLITLRNALENKTLKTEVRKLRQKKAEVPPLIGVSSAMQKVKELIEKVAPTDVRVLITGESGVGKEVVARHLHLKSNRSNGPFVSINCGALPSELIESELFGHEKGAFTSAVRQHIGSFERANGGTLFLDEIGEMPPSAQVKLLRALEEKAITRVGGEKKIPVDVRVISATNKDLKKEIEKGNFRLDLYHRINVVEIRIPPLRERPEDIPPLVEHFVKQFKEEGLPEKKFPPETLKELQQLPWHGNIRELRNAIERLLILVEEDTVTPSHIKEFLT